MPVIRLDRLSPEDKSARITRCAKSMEYGTPINVLEEVGYNSGEIAKAKKLVAKWQREKRSGAKEAEPVGRPARVFVYRMPKTP